MTFQQSLARAASGGQLSRSEIVTLLNATGDEVKSLFETADDVRLKNVGDDVHLRGIIEFSNYCRRNCQYCGIRAGSRGFERYRIPPDEIVEIARQAHDLGYETVVLQSGEDMWYTAEMLADVVSRIKSECDMAVTLSVGERTREE
ncbi:MAG: biotin synthase BioB, partial [Mycobacterium leprae]